MSDTILGIIPARGGSKGVPRKNIRPLGGKPLIGYAIEAASASRFLTETVISTDDDEIADVSRRLGGSVPFKRPPELATDSATGLSVVQHAVREMEDQRGYKVDVVVLLQPTTPFRTTADIDAGINLLLDTGADSVVSVADVGSYHPLRMKRIVGENILVSYIDQGYEDLRPRQQLPPVYIRSGDLYISRRAVVIDQNRLVGADCRAYIIPPARHLNIDTEYDFWFAEYLIGKM